MEEIPSVKKSRQQKYSPDERAKIGGENPDCEKIPIVKILPRSESAEIGEENPNCEKIPFVKILPRSVSAEIG